MSLLLPPCCSINHTLRVVYTQKIFLNASILNEKDSKLAEAFQVQLPQNTHLYQRYTIHIEYEPTLLDLKIHLLIDFRRKIYGTKSHLLDEDGKECMDKNINSNLSRMCITFQPLSQGV